ncbi:MAG: 3-deoxy-8-phosphooctulonate synthase, partial [Pseudomonadota bacterium]
MSVQIGNISIANDKPFVLIAGPCAMENAQHALDMAGNLRDICADLGMPFIYKTSFDKANRTSIAGARGIGIEDAMPIFDTIRSEIGCPVLTDVHLPDQCDVIAQHVDILQIPAYLCRQTDLLLAAGQTQKAINVKKGQFLAPWDMKAVVEKLRSTDNDKIMVCERGASFGYNTLVSDLRALPIMAKETGAPVVFDATHSV